MMLSLLTILFIGLKLTGHIDWSWWVVVLPTLVHVAIVLSMLVLASVVALRKTR